MLPQAALLRVIPGLPRVPIPGPLYRAVNFDYLLGPPPGAPAGSPVQPLWAAAAKRDGARYTPKQTMTVSSFDSLYVAEDELTPLAEVAQVARPPGSPTRLVLEPMVLLTLIGSLADVIDLTDVSIQSALGTNLAELTGTWLIPQSNYLAGLGPMPPTQALALAAHNAGTVTALRYPSSKAGLGVALIVFPDRLVAGRSQIEVFNGRSGRLKQRLP